MTVSMTLFWQNAGVIFQWRMSNQIVLYLCEAFCNWWKISINNVILAFPINSFEAAGYPAPFCHRPLKSINKWKMCLLLLLSKVKKLPYWCLIFCDCCKCVTFGTGYNCAYPNWHVHIYRFPECTQACVMMKPANTYQALVCILSKITLRVYIYQSTGVHILHMSLRYMTRLLVNKYDKRLLNK